MTANATLSICLSMAASLLLCRPGLAQTEFKVFPDDGQDGADFGQSIAVSGNWMIVGASGDNNDTGAAYLFRREETGWVLEGKLTASDGEEEDEFGRSVSLGPDLAAVGADKGNGGVGVVYLYRLAESGWEFEARLTPSEAGENAAFGRSVSLHGEVLAVGADNDLDNRGSAFVFEREETGWIERASLSAPDGQPGDRYGREVSIFGDWMVVASEGRESGKGVVFVYQREDGTWDLNETLRDPEGADGDNFGQDVSVHGDFALVGVDRADNDTGAAHVFRRTDSAWEYDGKLTASDGEEGDRFGLAVSLSGNLALISADGVDNGAGAAYVFQRKDSGWQEAIRLQASDRSDGDDFGESAALDGFTAVIGAENAEGHSSGIEGGAAYVVDLSSTSVTAESPSNLPSAYRLLANYPNPFNPQTTIGYVLSEAANVRLAVYDIYGRHIRTLDQGYRLAGHHEARFHASDLVSGVYVYRLQLDGYSESRRMTLLK